MYARCMMYDYFEIMTFTCVRKVASVPSKNIFTNTVNTPAEISVL